MFEPCWKLGQQLVALFWEALETLEVEFLEEVGQEKLYLTLVPFALSLSASWVPWVEQICSATSFCHHVTIIQKQLSQ